MRCSTSSDFRGELNHQSQLAGEAQGKLGAGHTGGVRYYLWSLTWGLGWAPALAALGGVLAIWRKDKRLGWMLVPAPLLFLAFMGLQGRYFGRWLLPIFPIVCLLAAWFALDVSEKLCSVFWGRGGGGGRVAAGARATVSPARGPRRAGRARQPSRWRRSCCAQGSLQRPFGPGALARGHENADARMDGGAHTEGREDRRRAGVP